MKKSSVCLGTFDSMEQMRMGRSVRFTFADGFFFKKHCKEKEINLLAILMCASCVDMSPRFSTKYIFSTTTAQIFAPLPPVYPSSTWRIKKMVLNLNLFLFLTHFYWCLFLGIQFRIEKPLKMVSPIPA